MVRARGDFLRLWQSFGVRVKEFPSTTGQFQTNLAGRSTNCAAEVRPAKTRAIVAGAEKVLNARPMA